MRLFSFYVTHVLLGAVHIGWSSEPLLVCEPCKISVEDLGSRKFLFKVELNSLRSEFTCCCIFLAQLRVMGPWIGVAGLWFIPWS